MLLFEDCKPFVQMFFAKIFGTYLHLLYPKIIIYHNIHLASLLLIECNLQL